MRTHTCSHKKLLSDNSPLRCVSRRRLGCEGVTPCSGATTPQVISSSVRYLADALSHIEQGLERRFLKPPLGETLQAWKDLEQPGKIWKSID